jgi:hypothetical protein
LLKFKLGDTSGDHASGKKSNEIPENGLQAILAGPAGCRAAAGKLGYRLPSAQTGFPVCQSVVALLFDLAALTLLLDLL